MKMRIILYSLIFASWISNALNTNNSSNTTQPTIIPFEIDYLSATNISFYDDCSLSFELNIIGINKLNTILSSNLILQKSILYWLHSHIFLLIDISFVYETDEYTNDLWHEYYLHLTNISNPLILSINICVEQSEIKQIIETELNSDGDEIAAFLRYKLTDHIQTYYKDINTDNLQINMIFNSDIIHTTDTKTPISINNVKNSYIFTEKIIYVGIIGVCIIMMTLIIMVCIILGIKHRTEQRFQEAIKDIKLQQKNAKKTKEIAKMDRDIKSIEPIHINIPSHLMSIDHGLNRENVLSEDDGNDSIKISRNDSIRISRNKLALMPQTMTEINKKQMDDLAINIDNILEDNNVIFDCETMHSLSARESVNMNKKQINYNRNGSKSVIVPHGIRNKNKNKNYAKKERHSVIIARKRYAKRKVVQHKKRSKSKPNLRRNKTHNKDKYHRNKLKRKKLKQVHSDSHKNKKNNNKLPLQSHSLRNLNKIAMKNDASLSSRSNIRDRHKRNNNKLPLHSHSLRNLNKIAMKNDVSLSARSMKTMIEVDISNIPQPHSQNIHDEILHDWASESSKSSSNDIIVGSSTTIGTLQIQEEMSNSDAHSVNINKYPSISTIENDNHQNNNNVNVYKVVQSDKDRVTLTQKIPPNCKKIAIPPAPASVLKNKNPINAINRITPIHRAKRDASVHIKLESNINHEKYPDKPEMVVQPNISLPYQPNF